MPMLGEAAQRAFKIAQIKGMPEEKDDLQSEIIHVEGWMLILARARQD
jgi:hypothetical protein